MLPPAVLVDTHCHLTDPRFAPDLPEVLTRAAAAGVGACLTIATGLADAERAAALCSAHPQVAMSAGLDPFSCHQSADADGDLARLDALAAGGTLRAVGEFGVEFHHAVLPRERQEALAEAQLRIAAAHGLPVVLHARSGGGVDAHAVMLAVLDRVPGVRGVIHSFDGDGDQAAAYVARGLHVAVNGMVTFPANARLRAALARVPPDRLLLETDAPYLSPVPLRGRRNEPAHLVHTLAAVAAALGRPVAAVADETTANARTLFFAP
jgi:TatD DNase family protein